MACLSTADATSLEELCTHAEGRGLAPLVAFRDEDLDPSLGAIVLPLYLATKAFCRRLHLALRPPGPDRSPQDEVDNLPLEELRQRYRDLMTELRPIAFRCERCDGKGKYFVSCGRCSGYGCGHTVNPCPTCNGTGQQKDLRGQFQNGAIQQGFLDIEPFGG